jgi:hypothetical protein
MLRKILCSIIFILFLSCPHSFSCTIFTAKQNEILLAAGSEDGTNEEGGECWFVPATANSFGYVMFRIPRSYYVPFSGMNEHGLFFDAAGVPPGFWQHNPAKLTYRGFLDEKMMMECRNIEDVEKLYTDYNDSFLQGDHLLVCDDEGKTDVIEWGNYDVAFIRTPENSPWHLITNFYLLNPTRGWYPCARYTRAKEMLTTATEYNFELFRQILIDVGSPTTDYGLIVEPKNRVVYVFSNYNYDEYAVIDVPAELQKGEHRYTFSEVFAKLELVSPANGITINRSEVKIRWEGSNTKTYEVRYSTNPSELESSTHYATAQVMHNDFGNRLILCASFLVFGGVIICFIKKPKMILFIICLSLLIITIPACEDKEAERYSDVQEYSFTISNLQGGTTYYWKIVASGYDGLSTQSITQSFNVAAR